MLRKLASPRQALKISETSLDRSERLKTTPRTRLRTPPSYPPWANTNGNAVLFGQMTLTIRRVDGLGRFHMCLLEMIDDRLKDFPNYHGIENRVIL
jgi:hypothetical protein